MLDLKGRNDEALREQGRVLPLHVEEVFRSRRGCDLAGRAAQLDDEQILAARFMRCAARLQELQREIEFDLQRLSGDQHPVVDVEEEQLALEVRRKIRGRRRDVREPVPHATVAAREPARFEIRATPPKSARNEQRRGGVVLEHFSGIRRGGRERNGDRQHGDVVDRGQQTGSSRHRRGAAATGERFRIEARGQPAGEDLGLVGNLNLDRLRSFGWQRGLDLGQQILNRRHARTHRKERVFQPDDFADGVRVPREHGLRPCGRDRDHQAVGRERRRIGWKIEHRLIVAREVQLEFVVEQAASVRLVLANGEMKRGGAEVVIEMDAAPHTVADHRDVML